MDLFFEINKMPALGETIEGQAFHFLQGGKGANQAIAAAKLGNQVAMIGCVGSSVFGTVALKNFEKYGVNHTHVRRVEDYTGVALVTIQKKKIRDNSIISVPGANRKITKEMIDKAKPIIKTAKAVLLQLETPMEVVEYVIDLCYKYGVPVILNPSPYQSLREDIMSKVTFMIPNEIEIRQMFPNHSIELSCAQYPNKLIVTRGSMGAVYHNRTEFKIIDGIKVTPVDTTGAGDAFLAAFVTEYIKTKDIEASVTFANICAGLSITKIGAQESSPSLDDVSKYLKDLKNQ
ncbi:MAG: ribokinase [Tenericutes bacterium HGW-Tenericutes-3]|nr:MAG: ribokinase [Tenericutes bacterium HGW-Tenericutes-3]